MPLSDAGAKFLGTTAEDVDLAEDRRKFSALLDQLGISQPSWSKLLSIDEAKRFAEKIGYPVIVRPSYVLSGSAMRVAYNESHWRTSSIWPQRFPVTTQWSSANSSTKPKKWKLTGSQTAKTCYRRNNGACRERGCPQRRRNHDYSASSAKARSQKKIEDCTHRIVKALKIHGPYNIQYLVKDDVVNVIECNLRASRSMPFVSKTRGINLIELATLAMLGKKIDQSNYRP